MARMIDSPTTASAAATTMMKKMKTTPVIESRERAKPMKDRFTAFSINSMLMKMTITLRRNITPSTPIENKRALRMRMWVRGIILISIETSFGNHYCTDHRDQKKYRNDFERQHVFGEK